MIDIGMGQPHIWQELYDKYTLVQKLNVLYPLENDEKFDKNLIKLHKQIGNYIPSNTDKIVYGNGSSQVLMSIFYALGTIHDNLIVYQRSPRYILHNTQLELLNIRSTSNINDIKDTDYLVEIVTSPNNPDGYNRKLSIPSNLVILDAVYDWPWYNSEGNDWIYKYREKGGTVIPLYSFSKTFGLAGQRLGYAFIDEKSELLPYIQNYIEQSTVTYGSVNKDICDEHLNPNLTLISIIYNIIHTRYKVLSDLLIKHGYIIHSKLGSSFLWVKGKDIFKNLNVKVLYGSEFGVTDEYARLNLSMRTSDYEQLLTILSK